MIRVTINYMVQGRTNNSLRKHRKMQGYSIKEVASLLDIHCANRLSRWEKGVSLPNLKNVLKLSLLYHTFIEQLYEGFREELKKPLYDREQQLNAFKSKAKEHDDSQIWIFSTDWL